MTVTRDLQALERLIDDPSPVVRGAVLERIRSSGSAGMRWLRGLATHPELGGAARDLLRRMGTPEAAALGFLAAVRDESSSLEEGFLALERIVRPELPDDAYEAELARLAARVRDLSASPAGIRERLKVLSRVFVRDGGYQGEADTSDQPDASLLSKVIASRRGNPLSLCALYLMVARRAGIDLDPVSVPGRFMVGWFGKDGPIYVDVFAGCEFRTRDEIALALRENDLPDSGSALAPADRRETLARACRNLTAQYGERGDAPRAGLFAGLARALSAPDPHGPA